MQHKNIRSLIAFVLLSSIGFTACKKDIKTALPGNTPSAALNFYTTSDLLFAGTTGSYAGIYVDKYIDNPLFNGSTSNTPFFFRNSVDGGIAEFPNKGGGVVTYLNYNVGSRHLFFADPTNTVTKDTTIHTADQSVTCVYLADAPAVAGAPAAYNSIAIQEDRSPVPDNKVGVRFIHLSPDAGDLTVSQVQPDETQKKILSNALHYAAVTPYQYMDSTASINGQLRFSLTNTPANVSLLTGVPFNPGRRYVVVISGFVHDQQRKVNTKDPTGPVQQTSVNITHNLRATVRRIY